ncbi:MAG: HAD-IA family hydrolase [Lachnospiraceae bacterium]|nr:HAD-IA family hydrolase [Lachnospiraceae bacterium]
MAELILFDLDGTLTDSGPGIINCVKYAFEKLNFTDYDEETLRSFVGPPLSYRFQEVLQCSEEEALHAVALYRERYTDTGIWENSVYEGIPEVLTLLRCAGKKLAVATSKPQAMAERVLERFELSEYFDVICGSKADGKKAEKTEILREVLAASGFEDRKDQVLLIGDTKYDVLGAKAVGIDCVGVSYGYGTSEELEESGAVKVVNTAGELVYIALDEE